MGGARVTGLNQQFGNRVLAAPGQAGDGADRLALAQQAEDLGAGLSVQLVPGWSI
jgi:hypothetical protein